MNLLLIQQFLQQYTLRQLQEQHGVYASFSKCHRKMSLNYDAIETKDSDILTRDCRGIVLSRVDYSEFVFIGNKPNLDIIIGNTKIIAFGMRRFFNVGQGECEIDWSDPSIETFEKIDGTLTQLYKDPITQSWQVATRSVSEADILLECGLFTFRQLFEKALLEAHDYSFINFTDKLNPNYTYCFELTSPFNRIVCQYDRPSLTLLAVRDLTTLQEIDPKTINSYGIPLAHTYPHMSMEKLINYVSSLNPLQHEGVVVQDNKFNRIKCKNLQYVAMSKLRDSLGNSERNCMELILLGKDDDAISALPQEIVDNLLKLKTGLQKTIQHHDRSYQEIKQIAHNMMPNSKKHFALELNKHSDLWAAPLFAMYDNKANNMRHFLEGAKKLGSWSSSILDRLIELSKQE